MLTREQAIADYDLLAGRVVPDRLHRAANAQYLEYAERMLRVFRLGIGRTRRELHQSVWGVFAREPDCPARRIEAFCKLLDDVAKFEQDRRGKAAALRHRVFQLAARRHPLVQRADRLFEHEAAQVRREIGEELGMAWDEIDRQLFADVIDFHRLVSFAGYTDAAALLARYNVAQVQAALFDAVSMTITAGEDFKTILRYAKLARLLHTIHRGPDGRYVFRFDGPATVLRSTRRYGAAMARFLPALIACRDWRMHAVIATGRRGWNLALDLTSEDGLHSNLPAPEEFDSKTEEDFARKFGNEPREGWTLHREAVVLHREQRVFVPDFVFRHSDGREVLLEIIGFWTPEYLEAKFKTLEAFREHKIVLAVSEAVAKELPELPPKTIRYKTALVLREVLAALADD